MYVCYRRVISRFKNLKVNLPLEPTWTGVRVLHWTMEFISSRPPNSRLLRLASAKVQVYTMWNWADVEYRFSHTWAVILVGGNLKTRVYVQHWTWLWIKTFEPFSIAYESVNVKLYRYLFILSFYFDKHGMSVLKL